ncbi:hypothetical protein BN871_AI_00280 [Paenibacillus sp. P22]|nr:hypothetical protein BN871_AI_00280 [Paenibacillus sp. P22]
MVAAARLAAAVSATAAAASAAIAASAAVAAASSCIVRAFFTRTAIAVTGFEETDIVGNNLRHVDALAFIVLVVPYLHPAFNRRQTAFAQIVGARLGKLPPRDNRNEIGFAFPGLAVEGPVHRQRELRYRNSGRGIAKFWIFGQSANQNDTVQHRTRLPSSNNLGLRYVFDDQVTDNIIRDFDDAIQLVDHFVGSVEVDENVDAVTNLVDLIRKTALAENIGLGNFSAIVDDAIELFDESLNGFLLRLWTNDVHHFVFAHFDSPPLGLSGPFCLSIRARSERLNSNSHTHLLYQNSLYDAS